MDNHFLVEHHGAQKMVATCNVIINKQGMSFNTQDFDNKDLNLFKQGSNVKHLNVRTLNIQTIKLGRLLFFAFEALGALC